MQTVRVTAFVRIGFDALVPDDLDVIDDRFEIDEYLEQHYFNNERLESAAFHGDYDWWEWRID